MPPKSEARRQARAASEEDGGAGPSRVSSGKKRKASSPEHARRPGPRMNWEAEMTVDNSDEEAEEEEEYDDEEFEGFDDIDIDTNDEDEPHPPLQTDQEDASNPSPNSDRDEDERDPNDSEWSDGSPLDSESEQGEPRGSGRATGLDKRRFLTDAFDGLAPELQTVAREQPGKVGRNANKSKVYIKEHKSQMRSVDDLLKLIEHPKPWLDSSVWTEELEAKLQRHMANDANDGYMAYIRGCVMPPSNNQFITMWKKICRLRRQFPIDIISRLNYLEYGATARVRLEPEEGEGQDQKDWPDPIWTPRFCERLTRLALGGPWGDNMDLLALFLRYAVACRINDRRAMPFTVFDDGSRFTRDMMERLSTSRDATKSIPQVHHEVRHAIRQRGFELPWESKVLRNLEKLAYNPETPPQMEDENGFFYIYQVKTEDLRAVERAVGNCKDLGLPIFRSVKDSAAIISHGRSFDFPKIYDDVRRLQLAHRVYMERSMRIRREMIRQSTTSSPHADPEAEAEAEGDMDMVGLVGLEGNLGSDENRLEGATGSSEGDRYGDIDMVDSDPSGLERNLGSDENRLEGATGSSEGYRNKDIDPAGLEGIPSSDENRLEEATSSSEGEPGNGADDGILGGGIEDDGHIPGEDVSGDISLRDEYIPRQEIPHPCPKPGSAGMVGVNVGLADTSRNLFGSGKPYNYFYNNGINPISIIRGPIVRGVEEDAVFETPEVYKPLNTTGAFVEVDMLKWS
ncbi:hypothetical protein F4818DRAFT_441654 [Hypoxylon cercidicola]|nr:hypothetical protein F4818DRAFT_441654 [Hypoxylon cercidicola]